MVYIDAAEPTTEPIGRSAAEMVQVSALPRIVWSIYAAGATLMFVLILRQYLEIVRIRRQAVRTDWMTYQLIRTELRITPFSFLRTIYIWQQTPDEELSAIIAHERSHIRRGHTVERLVVEGFKALFWWNPFCWLVARTLAEVEEFEADQDVLGDGFSHDEYMTILFRQLFGLSPDIANGLPHSFTKKRFQMMTKQIKSSHQGLRATAAAVVVAGLVCAFSFKAQATEYRTQEHAEQPATPANHPQQSDEIVVTGDNSPSTDQTKAADDEPFMVVEQMPTFEGGDFYTFRQWVMERIRPYKDDAGNLITGRVVVQFIVERDGTLTNVKVMQSPDSRLNDEVIRLLAASPRWEAGMQRGKKVRVQLTLPIHFSAR